MAQKFYAHPSDTFTSPNGAIGHRSGGPFDCIGPFAKVRNCPIIVSADGTYRLVGRLTCYATGYADTFFSVPACTRYRGKYIAGFFINQDDAEKIGGDGIVFHVMDRHADRVQ